MMISKVNQLTACVMTSIFALSLFGAGCATKTSDAAGESNSALQATACAPVDEEDDEDEDIPAPLTDAQLKALDDGVASLPKDPPTAPAPSPVTPSTPAPTPTPLPAPKPAGELDTRATAMMICCAGGDSPRRAALKDAARKRREEYDDLYKKLTGGGVIAAGAGYIALQVKNGKPPTQRELAALGITITAGIYATYYTSAIDIERRYKRLWDAAQLLSDEKPQCD